MSEELVKALARRFSDIADGWGEHLYPNDAGADLARECIRQMKWTLKCAAEVTRQIGPEEKSVDPRVWELWAKILETGPLILAPEDWKP